MPSKRTVPRVCCTCGADFFASIAHVNAGGALYCTLTCRPRRTPLPPSKIVVSDDGLTASVELSGHGGRIQAHAIIDAADADIVAPYHWYLGGKGYAERSDERGTVRLHRVILGLVRGDGLEGDHRSRDKLDCRRENLRTLPKRGNQQNTPSKRGSSSQYRGVCWNKGTRKWMATITVNRKPIYLGQFDDEQEAASVALGARRQHLPYSID